MQRREFLQVLGTAPLLAKWAHAQEKEKETAAKTWLTPFGKTGLTVPRLAIGTGMRGGWGRWLPSSEVCVRLLQVAHDSNVTWFDVADRYGSHPHVKEALKGKDRSKIIITTKTPARDGEQARKDVERYLKEMNTDYVDVVLMHAIMDPNWATSMRSVMDALSEAKERKLIRAIGLSCHNLSALKAATENPWVEVILARLNYDGVNMDATPNEVVPVLQTAKRNGKAVYGMKILGEGKLKGDPEKCIRYAFETGVIPAMTIGMMSEDEIKQDVGIVRGLFPKT